MHRDIVLVCPLDGAKQQPKEDGLVLFVVFLAKEVAWFAVRSLLTEEQFRVSSFRRLDPVVHFFAV